VSVFVALIPDVETSHLLLQLLSLYIVWWTQGEPDSVSMRYQPTLQFSENIPSVLVGLASEERLKAPNSYSQGKGKPVGCS
jgi:hypothetical protein